MENVIGLEEFLIGFLCLLLVCVSGRELRNRDIEEGKRNPYSDNPNHKPI